MRRARMVIAAGLMAGAVSGEGWYRGNLHMHSLWSDGNVFPEEAVKWYREHDYQFVCLSDHQLLQIETNIWLEVGSKRLSQAQADRYLAGHPASAEVRTVDGKRQIRLKTVWELKRLLEQPGSFLMMPGHELNRVIGGLQVHMNALNVHDTIPFRYGSSATETFSRIEGAVRAWGEEQDVPTLFMLNHPTWPYFDITPEVLIALPQIRLFELCNADGGHTFPPHPEWYSMEKFWDIVNAFRVEDGFDVVFGAGTDDTHNYTDVAGSARPGEAWVCVRAASLESDALVQAMYRGDFYSSTGVELESVSFDAASGTLSVAVNPRADTEYTVRFITTRTGFDRTVTAFDDPSKEKKPSRKGLRYAAEIGREVLAVPGPVATYTMAPEDLYVRATVVSTRQAKPQASNEPAFETAWTQPYGWRQWQRRNALKSRLAPLK